MHDSIKLFPENTPHALTAPEIQPPGYFVENFGVGTVFSLFLARLIYGGLAGGLNTVKKENLANR